MIDFLIKQWDYSLLLLDVLVICDHYLTSVGAKLYHQYGMQFLTFQNGYELNPRFEKEVAQFRWFTKKLVFSLAMLDIFMLAARFYPGPALFEFLFGGAFLLWIIIDLRHLQNILAFRDFRQPNKVSGHIEYSYWFSQRSNANNLLNQAILLLIVAVASQRLFFWGGVFLCVVMAIRGYRLSKRVFPQQADATKATDEA